MSQGLFELRKDIIVPGHYYRAGDRKTMKEWEVLFPHMARWDIPNWLIDLDALPKPPPIDIKRALVNEVFEKAGLRSISYKEAAVECITEYEKRLAGNG